MKPFFGSADNLVRLGAALETWRGTPWAHRCGVKGVGADCVFFCIRVLEECGYFPPGSQRRVPEYGIRWFMMPGPPVLLQGVTEICPGSTIIEKGIVGDGDLIGFQMGAHLGHLGIKFGGKIWHSVFRYGVLETPASDPHWMKRAILGVRL